MHTKFVFVINEGFQLFFIVQLMEDCNDVAYHCELTCYNDVSLKTLDTIDNFQRPVFSLGVSQHMHKISNL